MAQPTRLSTTAAGLALLASLATGACIDLDVQTEVKDLRILAVRLDPPEILNSPFLSLPADQRMFPIDPEQIVARVLAADPRGDDPVEFTSWVCPFDSNIDCRNYYVPAEFEDERDPDGLKAALQPLVSRRTATIYPDDDFGTYEGTLSAFNFTERAQEYILPHGPGGAAFGLLETHARLYLQAENKGVTENAFRRIPINVDLSFDFDIPGLPPELAEQVRQDMKDAFSEYLGVEICTEDQAQQEAPDCLRPRGVNRNPVIEEIRYSLQGETPEYDDDGIEITEERDIPYEVYATGTPIHMAPGDELHIWPKLPDDVRETYQIFEFDLEKATVELANYKEDMAVVWYATQGADFQPITDLTLSKGYDTMYTYPTLDVPEQVKLWIIVHDQRGGVVWQSVVLAKK